jgi:hypothetical protein
MRFGCGSQLGNGEKMGVRDDDVVTVRGARDLLAVEAVA